MRRFVVLVLFLLSGGAGLMYQVVWTRNLSLVFGVTSQAVATVLAVFMGGFALGSWLLGRFGDSTRAPLRLYGFLELGIALFGFLSAMLFDNLADLYVVLRHTEWITPGLFPFVRVGLAGVALLVPTTLMGATLPILIRAFCRTPERVGRETGRLYAINTVGAVLGTLFAAFVLIEAIGLRATVMTAAGINLAVGVISLLLSRSEAVLTSPVEQAGAPPVVKPEPLSAAEAGTLRAVLFKAGFWEKHAKDVLNARQIKVLNRMLDGFEGKLTSSKWAKLAKCSQDTANRDITALIELGILRKGEAGGRSTSYRIDQS